MAKKKGVKQVAEINQSVFTEEEIAEIVRGGGAYAETDREKREEKTKPKQREEKYQGVERWRKREREK